MRIAVPAAAPFGNKDAVIRFGEIVNQFAGFIIGYGRAYGNPDFQILATAAMTIAPFAMPPALRAKYMVEPEFQECVLLRVGQEIDVAPAASIAPTGTAPRHELFSPKGNGTMPTVSGLHRDFCFIDEH